MIARREAELRARNNPGRKARLREEIAALRDALDAGMKLPERGD